MLAASVSAWAQTSPSGPEKTLSTVEVKDKAEIQSKDTLQTKKTSIGKGSQDIRDIPQSVTVITEKLLDDRRIETLKEALQLTGGISFAATENGTDQDIRLRGFPIASTGDLMIDGMKDPSQYERDTFNMDRIEVMRGSASMVFGRGSTGGVVNQVNKQPMLMTEHEVQGTYDTRGVLRMTGDFNLKTGEDAALRLNVMTTKGHNQGPEVEKYGIAPTYRWGIGTANEFSVGLFHLDVDNTLMPGISYERNATPGIDPRNFYGMSSDFTRGKATYVSASHLHRFQEGGELKSQLRVGNFDRAQWMSRIGFAAGANLNDPSTVLTRASLSPRKDRYDTLYAQSDYSRSFEWGGRKHQVLAGIDMSDEKATRWQSTVRPGRPNTSVGTPDNGATIADTLNWKESSNYAGKSFGIYAQDTVEIAPSWKLLGGLRYDHIQGNFNTININTGAQSSASMSDGLLSHRLGVLYQPSPTASYHASYGTSFNSSADTYQYTDQKTANTPPEKSRNFEVGAKLDWLNGNLSTRGAIFLTEKYNERNTDSDTATTQQLLSGKRYSSGIDLDIVGRLSPQWEVYASYSWIPNAKITNSTNAAQIGPRVGLTPEHSGSVWASYQATPKLRIGFGIDGKSEVYPLTVKGTRKADAYLIGNALIEYNFNESTYARLNISNLTNKGYVEALYPAFASLGAGRTYKITVGTRF